MEKLTAAKTAIIEITRHGSDRSGGITLEGTKTVVFHYADRNDVTPAVVKFIEDSFNCSFKSGCDYLTLLNTLYFTSASGVVSTVIVNSSFEDESHTSVVV